MNPPALRCGGVALPLGDRIGRGGEGEVYAVADGSNRAVKVYLNPDQLREAKVRAIVDARLGALCPNAAFPLEIVRHFDGRFAGFTMRHVTGHQPIHELITTSSRRQYFPHANWEFLVHVALNVARIVASVHAAGVAIGDINSAGFLVSQEATVTLIDADSFQVGAHRCRVGMPEFTPAELQGKRFDEIDRTPDHDAFGLAVLLFQILALGRHPYAGVVAGRPVQLDQAISQGRFAYSLIRNVSAAPPPAALRLDELPRAIRLFFELAFAVRAGPRPTAAEWVQALHTLSSSLAPCPRISNHQVAVLTAPCPWCRIEGATGRPIFMGGSAIPALRSSAPVSKLRDDAHDAIRRARRHADVLVMPMWSRPKVGPSKVARKALADENAKPGGNMPGLRAARLGLYSGRETIARHDAARVEATRALEDWRTRLGIWDIAKRTDELRGYIDRIDRVHNSRSSLVAQAAARAADEATKAIMARAGLHNARIAGIGAALREELARHGILTALDISRTALSAVGGVGEVRIIALLFWREAIAITAEHETKLAMQGNIAASADAAVDQHLRRLEHRVQKLIGDIESGVARVRRAVWLVDRKVESALLEWDQLAADLAYLGLTKIAQQNVMPTHVAPTPAPKKRGKIAKSCPRCGAPMVKRWGQSAKGKAALFMGCTKYPKCNGTQTVRRKNGLP